MRQITMDELVRYAGSAWARHDTTTLAAVGAMVGVGSHLLYWMHGLRAPQSAQIFWFHVAAFTLVAALSVYSHGFVSGILAANALCWSYLAGVFVSTAIYRVWFHRLCRFPGPFPAKVSKFYGMWRARRLNAHNEAVAYHERYGDFVRTGTFAVLSVVHQPIANGLGPMDLMLRSAEGVQKVMGASSPCTKRGMGVFEIFDLYGGFSLETLPDTDAHRARRQIWDRAQNSQGTEQQRHSIRDSRLTASLTAMAKYETETRKVVRTWLDRLDTLDGAPIEITKAMLLVAFDNMGKLGFSKEFGAVASGEGVKWLDLLDVLLSSVARLGGMPWPILVAKSIGQLGDIQEFSNISAGMAEDRLKVGLV